MKVKDYRVLKQLCVLLETGYSLNEAVDYLLLQFSNYKLKKMKKYLNDGIDLLDIMEHLHFGNMFFSYFYFFYQQYDFKDSLKCSLEIIDKLQKVFSNLKKQMFYPCMLLIIFILVSILLSVFMVPQILSVLDAFDYSPSLFIKLSLIFFNYLPYLVLISVLITLIIIGYNIYLLLKFDILNIFNKLIGIKKIISFYFSFQFSVYFYYLLAIQISLEDIFKIINKSCNQKQLKNISDYLLLQLNEGVGFIEVINDSEILSLPFKQMLKIGLQSGDLVAFLEHYHQQQITYLNDKVQFLTNVVTPIIFSSIGIFVIGIYLLMVMPMLNIMQTM